MSFKHPHSSSNIKTNKLDDKTTPLISEDFSCHEAIIKIQNKFIHFNKHYDEILEYYNKLPYFSKKEYDEIHPEIHKKIAFMPTLLAELNELGKNALNTGSWKSSREKISHQLKLINEKVEPKQRELTELIDFIYDRESKLAKKLSVINFNAKFHHIENDSNDSAVSMDGSVRDSKRNSNASSMKNEVALMRGMHLEKMEDDNEYLQNRLTSLEKIKEVSAEVKEISVVIIGETRDHIDKLKTITEITKDNKTVTTEAEVVLPPIEKESKSNKNKEKEEEDKTIAAVNNSKPVEIDDGVEEPYIEKKPPFWTKKKTIVIVSIIVILVIATAILLVLFVFS